VLLTDDFSPVNLYLTKEVCNAIGADTWTARGDGGRQAQSKNLDCRKKR
jgi:hypothetical protein